MTARWHLGPISGWDFWWLLVSSPEILVFLFFMITDPQTIPRGRVARLVYAVSVGLLATLLIAPVTTEFATKVAVLAALALVCLGRPLLERALPPAPRDQARRGRRAPSARRLAATLGLVAAVAVALVALDGIPARPTRPPPPRCPPASRCRQSPSTPSRASRRASTGGRRGAIARDVVLDLRAEADALRLRTPASAHGRRRRPVAREPPAPDRRGRRRHHRSVLLRGRGRAHLARPRQGAGATEDPGRAERDAEQPCTEVALPSSSSGVRPLRSPARSRSPSSGGHYVIVGSDDVTTSASATATPAVAGKLAQARGALAGVHLQDVARQVGLDFRQGAFRYGSARTRAR